MLIMQGNFTMIHYFLKESILNIYKPYFALQSKHTILFFTFDYARRNSQKDVEFSWYVYLSPPCHTVCAVYIRKRNLCIELFILYGY